MLPKRFLKRWPDPWARAAGLAGLACVVLLVLLLGRPFFTNASQPEHWGGAQLGMQFVRTARDVELILGDAPSPDREVMRLKLYLDFFYIAAYCTLFVALGKLVSRKNPALAVAATVCGLAGGVFDIIENRATLDVVNASLDITTQGMVDAVARAALVKWILVLLAAALFGGYFLKAKLSKS